MHEEALLAVDGAAAAHPAIGRSGAEPLRLDNLEGLFLLCSVATAAAALAIAAEAFGGKVAGFFKCVGIYVPERRERNCDALARRMQRNLNFLPK